MLTENRRRYLTTRAEEGDEKKRAEYDYRLLKWLESMLSSGEGGGISDINRVLDVLDRDSIRKYLKDENVDDLLKLVCRLMDILDFSPVAFTDTEKDCQGKKIPVRSAHVEKHLAVIPQDSKEMSVYVAYRNATDTDINRYKMLENRIKDLQAFMEPAAHLPEIRSPEYFKEQIEDAHAKGARVIAFDPPGEKPAEETA